MAFGTLEGAGPQPVVAAPESSSSPHPGLLSFGSPQAEVPLSGAGGVLLLQTVRKGNVSLRAIDSVEKTGGVQARERGRPTCGWCLHGGQLTVAFKKKRIVRDSTDQKLS